MFKTTDLAPSLREEFCYPKGVQSYLCGNSLGLQPKATRAALLAELDAWAEHAVEGHFRGDKPWMHYHEFARDGLSHVLGAMPSEVVAMNSLTANLHLLMASFYQPRRGRSKILIEAGAFSSDRHAVEAQIRFHGFDPTTDLIELSSTTATLAPDEILASIQAHGEQLALVLWPGVQYKTGQAFDLEAIAAAAHAVGARVGFDLAHAVGNLALNLHQSNADFAVWCSYKYLNSGAGAVAGAFVHQRHAHWDGPRLAGWWGHEAATRFQMGPQFIATPGADGWQLSNPPVLALAPLLVSLAQFQRIGINTVRARASALTELGIAGLARDHSERIEIITPLNPDQRGAQLSLRVRAGRDAGRALFAQLQTRGVLGDWREPDIIRVSFPGIYAEASDVNNLLEALR